MIASHIWGRTHTHTPRQEFGQSAASDTPIPPEEKTVRASRVLYDLPTHVTLGAKAAAGRAAGIVRAVRRASSPAVVSPLVTAAAEPLRYPDTPLPAQDGRRRR